MPQKIEPPNSAELRWLEQNLERLCTFGNKTHRYRFSLSELDLLYREWLESRAEDDPNPMINSFGAAFGQYFVDHHSMEWVVVTDEHGTEIAVCAQPGEVLVFPANFVAKRFVAKEVDFFAKLHGPMIEDIEQLRAKSSPRPRWKIW